MPSKKRPIPHMRVPPEDRIRVVELLDDIAREPEKYFTIRDYFDPQGRKRLEAFTARKTFPGVCNIAWLHYERGLPREQVPLKVEWGGLGERLFAFCSRYTTDHAVMARLEHYLGRPVGKLYGKLAQLVAGRYNTEEREAIEAMLRGDRAKYEVRFNE